MAFTTRSDRRFELLPMGLMPVGPGQYDLKDSALLKKPESFAPFGTTSERLKTEKAVRASTDSVPDGGPSVLLVGNQATPGPDTYSPKLKPTYSSSIPRKLAPFTTTGRRSEMKLNTDGAPVFYQTVYSTVSKAESKTFGPKPQKISSVGNVTSAPSIPVDLVQDNKIPIYDVAPSLAHIKQTAPRASFGRSSRFGEVSTASTLGPGAYHSDAGDKRRRWFDVQPTAAFRSSTDRSNFSKTTASLAAPGSYDVRGSLLKQPPTEASTDHQFFLSSAPRFSYKELEISMRAPGPGEYGDPGANSWLNGNRGVKISAPVTVERPQPRRPDFDSTGLATRSLDFTEEEVHEDRVMRSTKNVLAKSGSLAFLSQSERFPERKAISTPGDILIPEPGEYEAGTASAGTAEPEERPTKSRRLLRIPIRHEIRKQEKFLPPPVGYYESHKFPDFNVRKRVADKEGFLTTSRRFMWEHGRIRKLEPDTSVEVLDLIDPRDPNACMSITVDPHSETSISFATKKTKADQQGVCRGMTDMSNPSGFLSSVAREKLLDVAAPKRHVPGPGDYDVPRSEFVKKNYNTLFGDVA